MSIIGQNVNEVYTAAELATLGKGFGLGDLYTDSNGNQFIYVQAGGAIALGDVVQFTSAFSATGLTTASSPRGRRCGVAMAAIPSGSFGWVQIFGICAAANVLTLAAADTRLNTTATAGTPARCAATKASGGRSPRTSRAPLSRSTVASASARASIVA